MKRSFEPVAFPSIGVLASLHRRCFPEDAWDVPTLGEIFRLPGFFGRIALEDDVPVGFVLALDLKIECEILSLGVVPEARRTGVGETLLDCVCSLAQRRHSARVILEVAIDNEAALALYRGKGFARVGRRARYYRRAEQAIDALVLSLSLPPLSPSI